MNTARLARSLMHDDGDPTLTRSLAENPDGVDDLGDRSVPCPARDIAKDFPG